ncbi:MAG: 30S ribosomal protein S6 [Desulfobacterales bacterium]|nr:30S ribosomal protein S6 [Desulfobacterales bacterium]
MRKYETIFISDPDLQDQARTELFDKIRNIIAKENGILLDFDEWGNKKLAYEIKKKLRGHYVCMTYGGDGELVKELERNLRLSDGIMKFMTILLSEDVTAESLEQEVKDAEDAKAAEEAAKAEAAAAAAAEAEKAEAEEAAPAEEAAEEATEEAAEEAASEEAEEAKED